MSIGISSSEILLEKGGVVARQEYAERKARYGKYEWWKAYDEAAMRYAARDLMKAGKKGLQVEGDGANKILGIFQGRP
jgi:hypothetical protein